MALSWCSHCCADEQHTKSPDGSVTSCTTCGRLQQSPDSATGLLLALASSLNLSETHPIFSSALSLLTLAHDSHLLPSSPCRRRRRIASHIASACLYVALRQHNCPFMLLRLSDHLGTSARSLASTVLSLCRALKLQSFDFTDPTLFMHRLSTRLLGGGEDPDLTATALTIIKVAGFKKRSLIGACSAALYIACGAHGRQISKEETFAAVDAEINDLEFTGFGLQEFVSSRSDEEKRKESSLLVFCGHKSGGLCGECRKVFVEMSKWRNESDGKRKRAEDDVDVYINSEKEKKYKTLIWEQMNREYLKEQAEKRAGDVSKLRKERKQRQGIESSSNSKKEMASSKVNYDVLSKLLADDEGEGQRIKEVDGCNVNVEIGEGVNEGETEENYNEDDEDVDGYDEGEYNNEDLGWGNEGYEYNEEDGNYNEGYGDEDF